MLVNLQKIRIEKPVDKIIGQIRSLITSGEIKPGNKLPSERALSDHLRVRRSHIREAILKLEFYGILKKSHQNGTFVSGIGILAFEKKINSGQQAVEKDLLFHIKIAEAARNNILKSLMMIITPDIVNNYINLKVCDDQKFNKTLLEHQTILDCIISQDADAASDAMVSHLKDVLEFSENIKPVDMKD